MPPGLWDREAENRDNHCRHQGRVERAAQAAFDKKAVQTWWPSMSATTWPSPTPSSSAPAATSGKSTRSSTVSRTPSTNRRCAAEGKGKGRWVLLDFGDFVVHVQHADERAFYDLERLWKDCPVIEVSDA